MEQDPIYQDVAVPDVLSSWDGPLHYTSLQDPVQQQQQGNSGKGFICIWLDAFCLFQRQIIVVVIFASIIRVSTNIDLIVVPTVVLTGIGVVICLASIILPAVIDIVCCINGLSYIIVIVSAVNI
jgi:hypothetical protein